MPKETGGKKQPSDRHAAHHHRNKLGRRTRAIGEVRHLPDDPNLTEAAGENDEHSQPDVVSESSSSHDDDSDLDWDFGSEDGQRVSTNPPVHVFHKRNTRI